MTPTPCDGRCVGEMHEQEAESVARDVKNALLTCTELLDANGVCRSCASDILAAVLFDHLQQRNGASQAQLLSWALQRNPDDLLKVLRQQATPLVPLWLLGFMVGSALAVTASWLL